MMCGKSIIWHNVIEINLSTENKNVMQPPKIRDGFLLSVDKSADNKKLHS